MNILLINPGTSLGKPNPNMNYIFPFGLGYIASIAEREGHEVDVWDIHKEQLSLMEILEYINGTSNIIYLSKFMPFLEDYDIIGITGIVSQYLYIKKLVDDIKEYSNALIVLGGPLATYSYDIVLKNTKVDICVIGEGEQTFLEVISKTFYNSIDLISDEYKYKFVKGIAYKYRNKVIKNKDRDLIKDIDTIGLPAYHLFDMNFYCNHTGMQDVVKPFYKNKRSLPLITSRGCPYNCKFCSKSMKGIRMKSLDFIFKEIEYYINEFKIDAIHFVDELLLLNKKRFLEFCRRIKKYNILWDCQARINLVDKRTLLEAKKSGCVCIGFGIESGSQKILNNMNKQIKVEDIKRYLKYCIDIDLPVKIQIIYGYPGESKETIQETINLFKELKLPARRFSVITPLPGSELYEESKFFSDDLYLSNSKSIFSFIDEGIEEYKYLEFLSTTGGNVSKELFYNQTEFNKYEFWSILRETENTLFLNFIKNIIKNPKYVIQHWFVYKMYVRNWWNIKGGFRNILKLKNIIKIVKNVIKWKK